MTICILRSAVHLVLHYLLSRGRAAQLWILFEEYNHPCKMDFDEIKLAFEEVSTRNDCEKVLKVTGGVPWQVKKLIYFTLSIDDYEEAELRTILRSS